ncbi:unnamed protein product, partial [Urochloa humidicola]
FVPTQASTHTPYTSETIDGYLANLFSIYFKVAEANLFPFHPCNPGLASRFPSRSQLPISFLLSAPSPAIADPFPSSPCRPLHKHHLLCPSFPSIQIMRKGPGGVGSLHIGRGRAVVRACGARLCKVSRPAGEGGHGEHEADDGDIYREGLQGHHLPRDCCVQILGDGGRSTVSISEVAVARRGGSPEGKTPGRSSWDL